MKRRRYRGIPVILGAGLIFAVISQTGDAFGAALSYHQARAISKSLQPAANAVKPDRSYFAGKTITIIAPGAPGGTFDLAVRSIATAMGIYLRASIDIVNNSTDVGIPGEDQAAASPPNGLTLSELNVGQTILDFVTNSPGINFSAEKLDILGAFPATSTVWLSLPGADLPNFKDVVDSTTQIPVINLQNSSVGLQEEVILGAYGIHSRQIFGYPNSTTAFAGLIRGDAPLGTAGASVANTAIVTGQVVPLLQSVPANEVADGAALYGVLKNVPSYASFFAKNKPKTKAGVRSMEELVSLVGTTNQMLFAPPRTPLRLTEALSDAAEWAAKQSSTLAFDTNASFPPGFLPPTTMESLLKSDIKHSSVMARYTAAQP